MIVERQLDAVRLADRGEAVVLVVDVDAPAFPEAVSGRVAVFVGSPSDPDVRAAAEAMSAELFGS